MNFVQFHQLDRCLDLIYIFWVLADVLLLNLGLESAFHTAAINNMSADHDVPSL